MQLDAEDLRYRGLWWLFATVAALAVGWALQQESVDTAVVPIPERILEVVRWDEPAPSTPPAVAPSARRPSGSSSGGGTAPYSSGPPTPEVPFGDLFAAPTFGSDDVDITRWEAVFAELSFEVPESDLGPGFQAAGGDTGRDDAELPGGLDDLLQQGPRDVVLADVAAAVPSPGRAAVLSKVAPPPPVVSERAIGQAMRRWNRHPTACRDRLAPTWRGRVNLVVWLEDGQIQRLEWDGVESVPDRLMACLETRARHLLRFGATETGRARLPLVFE